MERIDKIRQQQRSQVKTIKRPPHQYPPPTPPTPPQAFSRGLALNGEDAKKGAGGMADTRDPEEKQDDDPRKSISAAPSFEEYMKQRDAN